MKWYNVMGIVGLVMFVIFWVNHSMTNWKAGVLIYEGFIPQGWDMLFLIIPIFLFLIYIGASIENGIERYKKSCNKE